MLTAVNNVFYNFEMFYSTVFSIYLTDILPAKICKNKSD